MYRHEQVLTKEYYTKLYAANEQTRARQHDMHHMVQTLQTLLEERKTERALAWIHEWQGSETKVRKLVYSQNYIIDAVIDGALGEVIEDKKIGFSYQGRLPDKLGISELDLCLLLSNLLENAKEAVIQYKEAGGENPNVEMKLWMQGNILLMDIRNSYIADEKKDGNDRESAWHGYGIRNIREIVNQYDGEIDFETEGTAFVVHVGLETELYV